MSEEFKKKNKMGKVALWLFIVMAISFFISGAIIAANWKDMADDFPHGNIEGFAIWGDSYSHDIDESYSVGLDDIKNIRVENVSTDINIIKISGDEIEVEYKGEVLSRENAQLPELKVLQDGSDLEIVIKRKNKVNFSVFPLVSESTKLNIYIPYSYNGDIEIDTISADISIDDFELNEIGIETVSGDVNCNFDKVQEVSVETTSGDIYLKNVMGSFYIESVTGDVEMILESIDFDSGIGTISGNIKIKFDDFKDGFELEYSTTSGSFKNDFEEITSSFVENKYAKIKYISADNHIVIDTVSGDLHILD